MQLIENYKGPLLGAVILHLGLLLWLCWHAQLTPSQSSSLPAVNVIQAVAVAEVVKPTIVEPPPPSTVPANEQPAPVQAEAEPVLEETPPPVSEMQAVKAEQAIEKQQQEKAAELRAEKLAQQKAAAAKARKEAEKAAALKKAEQEAQAERRAAEKQAVIKKRLAELAKQQQKAAEQLMARQLAAEEKSLQSAAISQQVQCELDKFKSLIEQAIGQHWIVPDSSQQDIQCKLLIRLAPGGVVLNVSLVKSSGDPALDRSAIAAVHKASPLPVPKDTNLFDKFRELSLTVHPEK